MGTIKDDFLKEEKANEKQLSKYEQALKKALLERARKKVLAIDHTKIGGTSFLKVCDLKDVDAIVTDHAADRAFLKEAARLGVETVQV